MPETGRGSDKFMLRLPDGMRERIKRAAEHNGRSMNAELVHRIELSFGLGDADRIRAEERALHFLENYTSALQDIEKNLARLQNGVDLIVYRTLGIDDAETFKRGAEQLQQPKPEDPEPARKTRKTRKT